MREGKDNSIQDEEIAERQADAADESETVLGQFRKSYGNISNIGKMSLALLAGGVLYGCNDRKNILPELGHRTPDRPVDIIKPFNDKEELGIVIQKASSKTHLIWDKLDTEEAMKRLENIDTLLNEVANDVNEEDGVEVPVSLVRGLFLIESGVRSNQVAPGIKRKDGNFESYVGFGQLGDDVAEQYDLKIDRNNQNKYCTAGKKAKQNILSKWRITDERFDQRKNIYATLKNLSALSKLYHGDWQLAIWGHHAGQGNVHKILSEYIRAKTGVKFGGGNKIYDFIHEHHISYGDLMEAYLNSDDKYDGVRAMMDHLSDDSKTYYPRILAASSTAYRAFYDWEAFAKERKRFRGDEVQTMPEKIVLRAEEKKWAKKFGAYKNSGDVQAAILRGELVDVPVGATSLGFHVDTSQIGNSLKAGDVGGTEQLREIRNRYRHTAKETYGLLLDVAKRFKESNPDSPTLVITALTRSNAYQKKIGGFAAEKLSNHCTGHAFDISVPRSFGPEPAKQKKWLKSLVNVLQEIEFKNAEVLFLAEPVHNPVCIHVSIGPKSVRYYQKYYEKHVTSNEHKPENKKGNFTWPVVLGGATALLLANKFRIQKENARRRQARMNKMPR